MATNNSWNNAISAANSAITLNSGTNAVSISSDASATTVNIATGAAAKTVTVGSTNTTSSLALKYGTADFTLASATGTVISALDTGEITQPLQPAFLATLSSTATDVTGDGTVYTVIFDTEVYDQNADYNNSTGVFTAPVTGRYAFCSSVNLVGLLSTHTSGELQINASNRKLIPFVVGPYNCATVGNSVSFVGSIEIDMDAADTCKIDIQVFNGTKVVDVYGAAPEYTSFSGYLIC